MTGNALKSKHPRLAQRVEGSSSSSNLESKLQKKKKDLNLYLPVPMFEFLLCLNRPGFRTGNPPILLLQI